MTTAEKYLKPKVKPTKKINDDYQLMKELKRLIWEQKNRKEKQK